MKLKSKDEVLNEVNILVRKQGFLYALVLSLFEDFHINVYQAHEINYRERLSTKEATFLLGLLFKEKINFDIPDNPQDLISMKQDIYARLEELHWSFSNGFFEKMKLMHEQRQAGLEVSLNEEEVFGDGEMVAESIFYSGTGAYDVQYRDLIAKKYKLDKGWLINNKKFDVDQVGHYLDQIKQKLEKKSQKVNFLNIREVKKNIDTTKWREENPNVDIDAEMRQMFSMVELWQYAELFFEGSEKDKFSSKDEMREDGWKCFYQNLIELSVVRPSDFDNSNEIKAFLETFSFVPDGVNKEFNIPGDYNLIDSHPVVKLDEDSYLVTNSFLLYKAAYDSPFYWMGEDKTYLDTLYANRGTVGEELVYNQLAKVFGEENTYKSVIIQKNKTERITDIDVLCILGNYAICVQVKSKGLSLESWKGNNISIAKDFTAAVQKAYDQGVKSRNAILKKQGTFCYEDGTQIILPEEIDKVFILVITMENFPSITHQTSTFLKKTANDPDPLALSIFDLEILVEYLSDPYDFTYYVRQRVSLVDYFKADEEVVFLAYHLMHKLWPVGDNTFMLLPSEEGLLIDRNYYPKKRGIEIASDNDLIENRWKNDDFIKLCSEIKIGTEHKLPDILFHLFDMSGTAAEELIKYIKISKEKTKKDGKTHNFLLPPDKKDGIPFGITYISFESEDADLLTKRLTVQCKMRKYVTKADRWLGIGSLRDNAKLVDLLIYDHKDWEYDELMDEQTKDFYSKVSLGQIIQLKKIGRNQKCVCGSGLKYKKCCGK